MLKVKIIPDPESQMTFDKSLSQHSQLPIFNHSRILMCYTAYKLGKLSSGTFIFFVPVDLYICLFLTTKIFVNRGVANELILHPSFMHHLIKPTKGHACQRAVNVLGLWNTTIRVQYYLILYKSKGWGNSMIKYTAMRMKHQQRVPSVIEMDVCYTYRLSHLNAFYNAKLYLSNQNLPLCGSKMSYSLSFSPRRHD